MSRVNVTLTENPVANSGPSTDITTFMVAGVADQGPTTPVKFLSETDYTNTFGPRSTTSADLYDAVVGFFARNAGSPAWVVRVSDNTATSATLTLEDSTPAGTLTVTALTPGTGGNSIYVQVTDTDLLVLDADGNILETWPYSDSNAELIGVASAYVTIAQVGSVTLAPSVIASTALSGGADASDLTDSSYVDALNTIPPELGPATVAIPGQTSATIAQGLFAHAIANNRFAVVEQDDADTSASAISALQALDIPSTAAKAGIVVQGRPIISSTGGSTQTIPASGVVAALRDQVAATGGNPPPAWSYGQVSGVVGFTSAYNNTASGLDNTNFTQGDVDAMTSAGLCFWGFDPLPCLDEFVSPDTTDEVFAQATAWSACQMLVSQFQAVGQQFKGDPIDGQNIATTAFHSALSAVIQTLYDDDVLYGDSADDAASIQTGSPVNTTATAQAGQLNAQTAARLTPYADQINIALAIDSLTQSVGASS